LTNKNISCNLHSIKRGVRKDVERKERRRRRRER
jgi:hypothetical protein